MKKGFLLEDSRKLFKNNGNSRNILSKTNTYHSHFSINSPNSPNPEGNFTLGLNSSEAGSTQRPLNYYEKKEILHKILYEKNGKLIKDLVSKLTPEDLYRRKPKTRTEKKDTEKEEEFVYQPKEEEESESVEDTGYEEPTQINHVKAGSYVFHRNEVYTVVSVQHIAQARAKGHYKVKMHSLYTSKESLFSFPDGGKLTVIIPNKVNCVYSTFDDAENCYVFKGDNTEIRIPKGINIPGLRYLKPDLKVSITRWKNKILNVFVPFHIEYKVVNINKGNYAATLENGLVVLVPTYIKVNDHIEITTKAGEFLRRTKIA